MMLRCLIVLPIVASLIAAALAGGQGAKADDTARSKPDPASFSPEVHSDGRVTFRLQAPNAKKVVLVCEGLQRGMPMSKDEQGVWSVTAGPLAPDIYSYKFFVDGIVQADSHNPLTKPRVSGGPESMVHVPGPPSLSWELNDVPHGILHRHHYRSKVIGEDRRFWVYTPPGYDPSGGPEYPVLYLLHGVMEEAQAWTAAGRAHLILDNLIARGRSKPMLLVFPLGYGLPDAPRRAVELLSGMADQRRIMDTFTASLLEEVIPQVENAYRVVKNSRGRAIAGLSMGGAQAIYIGLNHSDRFAWIGSFSGAFLMYSLPFDNWFPGLAAEADLGFSLIWMACGKKDFLIGINRRFKEWLSSKGVQASWTETPGGHDWPVWRRHLTDFAPLLFRSEAKQAER